MYHLLTKLLQKIYVFKKSANISKNTYRLCQNMLTSYGNREIDAKVMDSLHRKRKAINEASFHISSHVFRATL